MLYNLYRSTHFRNGLVVCKLIGVTFVVYFARVIEELFHNAVMFQFPGWLEQSR